LIGVLVPDMANEFVASLFHRIEIEAARCDCELVRAASSEDADAPGRTRSRRGT
jgi:hypothetical protein